MKTWTWVLLSALALSGCNGDTDPTGETGDTEPPAPLAGFSISGTANDFATLATGGTAAAGLCVHMLDPTPALAGGAPEVLASGVVGEGGAFTVEGVYAWEYSDDTPTPPTFSQFGLLTAIQDCPDATELTVLPSATGIGTGDYAEIEDGGALTNVSAFSIDAATEANIDLSLTAAGYTGDPIAAAGTFVGFVFDDTGTPLEGATVACEGTGCDGINTYYSDTDPADGMFSAVDTTTGDTTLQAATAAAAGGLFLIPGAPISNYQTAAEGYEFDSLLAGSQPGYAVFVAFYGAPAAE